MRISFFKTLVKILFLRLLTTLEILIKIFISGLLIRDADWDREWDCPKGHRLAEDLEMIEVSVCV